MRTPLERSLTLALAGSALAWALVLTGGVEVEVGSAGLPSFSSIEGMVDDRLGEKLLDRAKQGVDERYSRERDAFSGKMDAAVEDAGGAPEMAMQRAEEMSETYVKELRAQSQAALSAKLIQAGYNDLLSQHTDKLSSITEIQSKVNSVQQKINQFKEIYAKAKFLMNR